MRNKVDFPIIMIKARRQWVGILKVLKEITFNSEF